ncbi:nephrin-like [Battus philenor]|uniref:nephrin-like n=1 Tax=Battus philenor TaxID=42288 RepID=UPI0035D01D0D
MSLRLNGQKGADILAARAKIKNSVLFVRSFTGALCIASALSSWHATALEALTSSPRTSVLQALQASVRYVGACAGAERSMKIVVLRAVRGRDARLPCGQGKVFLDGPDSYVLWLKNDQEFLYRFPNEDTENRSVNHDRTYGTSCDSDSCHDDTSLLLKRVSDRDGGIYRCRVHYQESPSQDYVINVRLVDSPGTPKIYSDAGELLEQGHVAPLSLGSNLSLVCEVDDEQPETLVYWRRNGVVLERAHSARPGLLRAEVLLRNATRSDLDAHYECLAQNADVTEPLAASLVVKMYLPPLSVEIRLNNNYDFEAGQPRVVDCVVVGCVPPPAITWHLGNNLLRSTVHKELHDGNYTVSSLTLVPSLRDNAHDLVCRAHNSHLPSVFEDRVTLNVGYRPLCLSSRDEKVGAIQREAETLTCVVEASPEPLQFSWTFADSRSLYTSVKKVPGHQHRYYSTLTWLPRSGDFGMLYCRASNDFGEQDKPCVFVVTPGGVPYPPDCGMLRPHPRTLRIECLKGWDGGRPQVVHLELFSSEGALLHNLSSVAGVFQLHDAVPDGNLTAILYSSSSRGRSQPKTIHLQTIGSSNVSAIKEHVGKSMLHQGLEATSGFLLVLVIVLAALFWTRCSKPSDHHGYDSPDVVPCSDGAFHREPDFEREERALATTNITVNQLASCPNQYTPSPAGGCRVLVDQPPVRRAYFV